MRWNDRELSDELNKLRGLIGVEIFHKHNLMSRLNIKDNVFAELVKSNIIIKLRNGRDFQYTLRKEYVTEQDIANAFMQRRRKAKEYNDAHKKVTAVPAKRAITIEEAIQFLKSKGYFVAKIC